MFDKYKKYSPAILRYGIGIVFLLLGYDQVLNPGNWFGWTPSFVGPSSFITSPTSFFIGTGIFNLIVGIFLILGLFTRFFAALAALHIIGVILVIGYNSVAVRDFGLLLGAIAVILNGSDGFCLDKKVWKKKN